MSDPVEIDVLILGGGINGCGTFRDLCAQGVTCLLLERNDFCSGASAGSSRLMHGGLKYLETGEFRLVRESLEERNRLLRNAAHVVSPLPSILPLRSRFGGIWPSVLRFFRINAPLTDRGSVITRLGLTLYDLYGRQFRTLPRHRMMSRAQLDQTVPNLDPGIIGGGLYYEGQISHAERLGLELILDGEEMLPVSSALNHALVTNQSDGIITYKVDDVVRQVRPRIVINAGGAWIDHVNAALGLTTHLMGGSKGAHLVVDNPALYETLNGHMVYFGTADGRVNLVYPFMGRVLIGSTDIRIDDPDSATCSEDEANYLRAVVSEIFPAISVGKDQILHSFSGVRPLPRVDGDIGMVTRDHCITTLALPGGVPVLCLIGGKWTTFRGFSEQVANKVLAFLDRPRRCRTDDMQIGGGKNFPPPSAQSKWIADCASKTGVPTTRIAVLLQRYGTRACLIAADLGRDTPLTYLPHYSQEELRWLIQHERVGTVEDLADRRTPITLTGQLTESVKAELQEIFHCEYSRLYPQRTARLFSNEM